MICSDNHVVTQYMVKATCWIKGDPCFATFQQVISDPSQRVYIGETPPLVTRVEKNRTKYIRSIEFLKVSPTFPESWFAGIVPLNPGLVAVIGNKGSGKTALAESIGLLGNTGQHEGFTFLTGANFKQPKNNKARHFSARLCWEDGKSDTKSLNDAVDSKAVETVAYIPQNYLETICNELQVTGSRFDQELKAVIFSHVAEEDRLGRKTLDELLTFSTEPHLARIEQLRSEVGHVNAHLVKLEQQGSSEAGQLLLDLLGHKQREIDAHQHSKPTDVQQPSADPAQQEHLRSINFQVAEFETQRSDISGQLKALVLGRKDDLVKVATAARLNAKLRNFHLVYEATINDIQTDCLALDLDPRQIVAVRVNQEAVASRHAEAQAAAEGKQQKIDELQARLRDVQREIEQLNSQLDAPNQRYQAYRTAVKDWEERLAELEGDESNQVSLRGLKQQIVDRRKSPIGSRKRP